MLGLNLFSLLVFIAINLFAAALCRWEEERRNRVLRVMCILLLSYNLCHYGFSPLMGRGFTFPVEFSTVSYFLVPGILLSGIKKAQSWAVYSGLMAGFFYYTTMILAGGSIYADYPPLQTYMALCCHGTLYVCGLVNLRTREYSSSYRYSLMGGVGYVVLNAYLLRPTVTKGVRLFIYELMDGVYMKKLLPEAQWNAALPVYYLIMTGLVLLTIELFFRLNHVLHIRYQKTVRYAQPVPTVAEAVA